MSKASYFLIDLIAPASAMRSDRGRNENEGASSPLTSAIIETVGEGHATSS